MLRDGADPEPLQRRAYDAAALVRQRPAVLRHENKQLLFRIATPPSAVHAGQLEYTHWPELPFPPALGLDPDRIARLPEFHHGY